MAKAKQSVRRMRSFLPSWKPTPSLNPRGTGPAFQTSTLLSLGTSHVPVTRTPTLRGDTRKTFSTFSRPTLCSPSVRIPSHG